MRNYLIQITLIAFSIASVSVIIFGIMWIKSSIFGTPDRLLIFTIIAVTVTLGYAVAALRFLTRTPVPLTISLLGFPGVGKTVYLTTLFDELQQGTRSIRFAPYGRETIEAVNSCMNLLSSGKWPPRTTSGAVFTYRATASSGGPLFNRQYKIEVADYAGETMRQLDPSEPEWLHKTEYFRHVIESDAILLALDAFQLLSADLTTREAIQNAYIAAFQVLAEEKGATDLRRLRSPVGLIFLKIDCVPKQEWEELENRVGRLVNICRSRCRFFQTFHVSSVGELGPGGQPPVQVHPFGVIDPLIWILQNAVPITPWTK